MKPRCLRFGRYGRGEMGVLLTSATLVAALVGCGTKPPADARQDEAAPPAAAASTSTDTQGSAQQQADRKPIAGVELYAQHCAACHGVNGDGLGPAAVFVFPRPRDFRAGRWRLISTVNGVPTPEDLVAVLERGMPGSAMVSWAHLPAEDRRALAEHVLKLRRDGARDLELKLAAEAEEGAQSGSTRRSGQPRHHSGRGIRAAGAGRFVARGNCPR